MYIVKLPFSDIEIDLNLYNRGDCILVEEEYDVDDDKYYFYFRYDFKNYGVFVFEVAKIVDGEKIFVPYKLDNDYFDIKFKYAENIYYEIHQYLLKEYNKFSQVVSDKLENVVDSITFLDSSFDNLSNSFINFTNKFNDDFENVSNNITDMINKVDNYLDVFDKKIVEIEDNFTNFAFSVDNSLSSLGDDLKEKINSLLALIEFFKDGLDITNLLDEKLSNVLAMVSLNGSNGAKFKDGDKVLVKGYIGDWEVLSSHIILTAENTNTVVYQVKQDKRVMLVPASFVTQGD